MPRDTTKKRRGTTWAAGGWRLTQSTFCRKQADRKVCCEKVYRRTYLMYFCMTSSKGRGPSLRKMDGFHMAARATITEEAAVARRKSSISKYPWMWS